MAILDEEKGFPLPAETEIERASLEAATRVIKQVAKQERKTKIRKMIFPAIKVAAAILLLVAVAILFIPSRQQHSAPVFSQTLTRNGERKVVTLADGSTVSLNNASGIKYPQAFNGNTREIYLDGEAFFKIIHDTKRPFIVHTGKLNVQVLGTSFNIRNYREAFKTEVTVATGKVGVMAKGSTDRWTLTPGQQLAYNTQNGQATQRSVSVGDYTGWQKGMLIFKNEQLEDICKRLEKWYGVKITIQTAALKSKRISLKQNNESLQTVLKMLGMAGRFKYEITDKTVKIW